MEVLTKYKSLEKDFCKLCNKTCISNLPFFQADFYHSPPLNVSHVYISNNQFIHIHFLILSNLFPHCDQNIFKIPISPLLTILKWHPIILRVDSIPQPGLEGSARWAPLLPLRDTFMLISLLQPPWTLSPHSHQAHAVFSWAVSSACKFSLPFHLLIPQLRVWTLEPVAFGL